MHRQEKGLSLPFSILMRCNSTILHLFFNALNGLTNEQIFHQLNLRCPVTLRGRLYRVCCKAFVVADLCVADDILSVPRTSRTLLERRMDDK
jgi:hypothetical protein